MCKNSKYQSISSECRLLINNFPLLHVLLNAPALVACLIQVQLMYLQNGQMQVIFHLTDRFCRFCDEADAHKSVSH